MPIEAKGGTFSIAAEWFVKGLIDLTPPKIWVPPGFISGGTRRKVSGGSESINLDPTRLYFGGYSALIDEHSCRPRSLGHAGANPDLDPAPTSAPPGFPDPALDPDPSPDLGEHPGRADPVGAKLRIPTISLIRKADAAPVGALLFGIVDL